MSFATIAGFADLAARALALAGVVVAGTVAATHWAVRTRKLAPFSGWSRTIRSISDPALIPIERRLGRSGGNPQDATAWLFGLSIVAGLLLVSGVRWLIGFGLGIAGLAQASPATWLRVVIGWAFSLVTLALFVRVIGSWFGWTASRPWMRPVYWLTDWLLIPIRKILPPKGMLDLSPLIAYFALVLLRGIAGV